MSYQGAGYSGGGIAGVGVGYASGVAGSGLERIVYSSGSGSYDAGGGSGSVSYSAESVGSGGNGIVYFGNGNSGNANIFYSKTENLLYAVTKANSVAKEYVFEPDDFLLPNRAAQPFVGDAAEVEEDVREAFFATTGLEFPSDIVINVLREKEFRKLVNDAGVVGFSVNRKENGKVSDVFVLAGEKDRLLLTIGHEVGHVLSKSLRNKHDEEAKAFAFSRAWMDAIKKEDIAGLGNSIVTENPARNGLHDVACAFVWRAVGAGKEALQLYWEIVKGFVGVDNYVT